MGPYNGALAYGFGYTRRIVRLAVEVALQIRKDIVLSPDAITILQIHNTQVERVVMSINEGAFIRVGPGRKAHERLTLGTERLLNTCANGFVRRDGPRIPTIACERLKFRGVYEFS